MYKQDTACVRPIGMYQSVLSCMYLLKTIELYNSAPKHNAVGWCIVEWRYGEEEAGKQVPPSISMIQLEIQIEAQS